MVMSSAANPLPGVGPGSRTIESRDDLQPISDKPIDNENQWCYGGKFKTVESAYEHWTMIGGSDIIDSFIQYFSGGTYKAEAFNLMPAALWFDSILRHSRLSSRFHIHHQR